MSRKRQESGNYSLPLLASTEVTRIAGLTSGAIRLVDQDSDRRVTGERLLKWIMTKWRWEHLTVAQQDADEYQIGDQIECPKNDSNPVTKQLY